MKSNKHPHFISPFPRCKYPNRDSALDLIGIDEVGRGCLAGPVVVAGVSINDTSGILIADSKKLSKKDRFLSAHKIVERSEAYCIIAIGHRRINDLNVLGATLHGFSLILSRLVSKKYLIDGNQTVAGAECIVGGDTLCPQISAASIIAKVYRDSLMAHLESYYPDYGLAKHYGYPTKFHRTQILNVGKATIHRNFKVRP